MYEINRNASVEYTPRARTLEFLTAIARGGTDFRSQVFLGASVVHGYIFIDFTQYRIRYVDIILFPRARGHLANDPKQIRG